MKNYEITYARITPTNDDIRISKIFIRPDNLKEAEKTFEKFVKDEKDFLSTVHSPFKILADFDRKNHSCKFYKVNEFFPLNTIVGKLTMKWVMCEN